MSHGKRGQDAEGIDQRPRKRDKYTRIACESCKSRKVKCSGSRPCNRCLELNADCEYTNYVPKPNPAHITAVGHPSPQPTAANQEGLEQLLSNMKKICDDIASSVTGHGSVSSPPTSLLQDDRSDDVDLEFIARTNLTNLTHTINLAKSILEERGILSSSDESPVQTSLSIGADPGYSKDNFKKLLDIAKPILNIGYDSACAHLVAFEEDIYPVYPCIDLKMAREGIDDLFQLSMHPVQSSSQVINLKLIEVEIIKAIIGLGMLIRDEIKGPLSSRLDDQLIWNMDAVMKRDHAQFEDVILATLMTIYHFLQNQFIKAWRMAGYATNACLELGMHRSRFYRDCQGARMDPKSFKRLFACVNDLEKKCSFIANRPRSSREVDSEEVLLDLNNQYPYLWAMLKLNSIHAEIVDLINSPTTVHDCNQRLDMNEKMLYLDCRVQMLAGEIAQAGLLSGASDSAQPSSCQNVMESFLRLRITGIRLLAHFWCLRSPKSFSFKPNSTQTLIDLSMSVVHLYRRINNAAGPRGVNRLWGPLADRILMRSVTCMLLAASYDPDQYGPVCGSSFHLAIDLLSQSAYRHFDFNFGTEFSLDYLRRIGQKTNMLASGESPFNEMMSFDGMSEPVDMSSFLHNLQDGDMFDLFGPSKDDYLAGLSLDSSN